MYSAIVPVKDLILFCISGSNNCSIKKLEDAICDEDISKLYVNNCLQSLVNENMVINEAGVLKLTANGANNLQNFSTYNTYRNLYGNVEPQTPNKKVAEKKYHFQNLFVKLQHVLKPLAIK
jgi:hypothetical protein